MTNPFQFKQFKIEQDRCGMKVGTDGVLLGAWINIGSAKSILDIGAGSGVITLMAAQRAPEAQVTGVEIDAEAATQAKENVAASDWSDRVTIVQDSIQVFAKLNDDEYDYIVSNPPFFSGGTLSHSQDKTNVRHTTKLAHGDLLGAVRNLLSPTGLFGVILPDVEGVRLIEVAKTYNLYPQRIMEVYPDANKKLERIMVEFAKVEAALIETTTLYIREPGKNEYTQAYKEITKDFYLKF